MYGAEVLLKTASALRSETREPDILETVQGCFRGEGVCLGFCLLLDCFISKQSHLSSQMAQTQYKHTHLFCRSSLKTRNNVENNIGFIIHFYFE